MMFNRLHYKGMKMFRVSQILLFSAGIAAAGCASGRKGAPAPADGADRIGEMPVVERMPTRGDGFMSGSGGGMGGAMAVMPKAVAYRMSGDYADRVPITLAPDGTLQSYPAPRDLSAASMPVELADGWWLDRRGVGTGSVFTRYTYSEYEALDRAPDPANLLESVIPGARVTVVMQLPLTLQDALADTSAVNAFIRSHALRPDASR